ncbi:MAG: polysaccharide biosynthesis C-terminal domain-containing protein [Bacteroidota bacterium]
MLYLLLSKTNIKVDFQLQRLFLVFAIPLMLHMFLGMGMEYIDGFLVTSQFEDPSLFAKFRYGARELPLATVLVGALTSAMIPEAVGKIKETLIEIKTRTKRLSHFLFPISMLLMLISPILFPIFYSEEFKLSAYIFNVYLLILSSRILLPQVIIFGKQHNYILVWSALIELAVNISLSILFIQYFGILGIAYATVIAYMINKLIMVIYNYLKFNISPNAYIHFPTYVLYNILLFICFFISLNY